MDIGVPFVLKNFDSPKYQSIVAYFFSLFLPGYWYLYLSYPNLILNQTFINILPLIILYSLPQYFLTRWLALPSKKHLKEILSDEDTLDIESMILVLLLIFGGLAKVFLDSKFFLPFPDYGPVLSTYIGIYLIFGFCVLLLKFVYFKFFGKREKSGEY